MISKTPVAPPTRPDLLKLLELVVAPASALTALLYYFGLLHAYWFLQTFGVEYTAMEFTTYDYLIRSADGLFIPLAVTAGAILATNWSHRLLLGRTNRGRATKTTIRRVALASGCTLLAVAIFGILSPNTLRPAISLPGLALSISVLVIRLAIRMQTKSENIAIRTRRTPNRRHNFTEWVSVFTLVNIGLFWAVADYSAAVGIERGRDLIAALPSWPDVAVYSERDLNLPQADTLETVCGDSESAYRFRYDGMKLILQSGSKYLLLPARWASSRGAAIVLPKTDAIRLDFTLPKTTRKGTC
jgi:hypothetical protein